MKIYVYPRVPINPEKRCKSKNATWHTFTKLIVVKANEDCAEVKPAGRGYRNTREVSWKFLCFGTKDESIMLPCNSAVYAKDFIRLYLI